jgi:hypothetical protein
MDLTEVQPNSQVGGVTPDDESRYFHGNPYGVG